MLYLGEEVKRAASAAMPTLLAIILLVFAFNIQPVKTEPITIIVPDDYPTIQEAINAASDGDTIFVRSGTYYEHVVVNKTVSLIGENRSNTIIDGSWLGTVVNITENNVKVTGFTIQWSYQDYHYPKSGIYLHESSSECNISFNVVTHNFYGIYAVESTNNMISNNSVLENMRGILLQNCSETMLLGNDVSNNMFGGILLLNSGKSTLHNNIMTNNGVHNFGLVVLNSAGTNNSIDTSNIVEGKPIYYLEKMSNAVYDSQLEASTFCLINCNNITIKDLVLTKNLGGIYFWNTTNSELANITVTDNYNGILLFFSSNNKISRSYIAQNQLYGIVLDNSFNNTICANNITSTGNCAIYLSASSENTFSLNNIVDNNRQVAMWYPSINFWDNGREGNYWSDYNGVDLDGDGIGDTPYVIDGNNTDNYPLMNLYWNPADVNHDLKVDIYDVVLACSAYSSTPSDPHWNPHCDIAEPYGIIDIYDIVMIAGSYGESW